MVTQMVSFQLAWEHWFHVERVAVDVILVSDVSVAFDSQSVHISPIDDRDVAYDAVIALGRDLPRVLVDALGERPNCWCAPPQRTQSYLLTQAHLAGIPTATTTSKTTKYRFVGHEHYLCHDNDIGATPKDELAAVFEARPYWALVFDHDADELVRVEQECAVNDLTYEEMCMLAKAICDLWK